MQIRGVQLHQLQWIRIQSVFPILHLLWNCRFFTLLKYLKARLHQSSDLNCTKSQTNVLELNLVQLGLAITSSNSQFYTIAIWLQILCNWDHLARLDVTRSTTKSSRELGLQMMIPLVQTTRSRLVHAGWINACVVRIIHCWKCISSAANSPARSDDVCLTDWLYGLINHSQHTCRSACTYSRISI